MPSVAERVSVVEVQVANLDEKIDEIKIDVNDLGNGINRRLDTMYDASCTQHAELASKIKDLEGFKNKWMMYSLVGLAFLAGTGWIGNANLPTILKFLGLYTNPQ